MSPTAQPSITLEDLGEGAQRLVLPFRGLPFLISPALIDALDETLEAVESPPSGGVLFVTGLTREGGDLPAAPHLDLCRRWEAQVRRFERLERLTVAVVDGECVGTGLELGLACDLRIATPRSHFASPAVAMGILPGMATFRLSKTTSLAFARRMILSGARVAASEAARVGLVDEICEVDALAQTFERLIAQHRRSEGHAVKQARRLLLESFATPYEEAIGHYLAAQHHCLARLAENDVAHDGTGDSAGDSTSETPKL